MANELRTEVEQVKEQEDERKYEIGVRVEAAELQGRQSTSFSWAFLRSKNAD